MASAIETLKKEHSAAMARARSRMREENLTKNLVRKGSVLTTAVLYGTMNRMAVPASIGGFPWKIGVGTLALLGEGMTSGNTQAVLGGIADSTLAIYTERAISSNTLIAGDEEDDGDEL